MLAVVGPSRRRRRRAERNSTAAARTRRHRRRVGGHWSPSFAGVESSGPWSSPLTQREESRVVPRKRRGEQMKPRSSKSRQRANCRSTKIEKWVWKMSCFTLSLAASFSMLLARATAAISAAMRLSLSRAASTTSSFSITAHASRVPLPRAMSWTTTIQQQHSSPLSTIQRTRRRLVSVASSASSPPPSETSKLEPPDVRKLAKMAQLEVTDEEVRR